MNAFFNFITIILAISITIGIGFVLLWYIETAELTSNYDDNTLVGITYMDWKPTLLLVFISMMIITIIYVFTYNQNDWSEYGISEIALEQNYNHKTQRFFDEHYQRRGL